jgi:cob(I)alamin adenosyltransferase
MSIATRTGDDGATALLFGRRISKNHPRVGAYGAIDELSAAIGMARASSSDPWTGQLLKQTQLALIGLMGQLAVDDIDQPRFVASKLQRLQPSDLELLDAAVADLEGRGMKFEGWSLPGENMASATLELARTVCRRAERGVVALRETGAGVDALVFRYLNRLSDVLWLLARVAEGDRGEPEV